VTLGESQGALIEGLGGESKHKGIHEVLDHLEIKKLREVEVWGVN